MKNFSRVLRLALRHRWNVAGAMLSALVVALLWGLNIGALYPVFQVVFSGQSLQAWIDAEIKSSEGRVAALQSEIAALKAEIPALAPESRRAAELKVSSKEVQSSAEQEFLSRRRAWKPYIDRYLPAGPFQTVVLIVAGLMIATVVKDLFLVLNSILVDRLTQLTVMELRKRFYRRTLQLDLAGFTENHSSELMSRFTYDMDGIGSGLQTLLGRTVLEPLKMVACLVGAAFICWRLLLVSLLIAPITAFLVRRLAQSLKRANRRAMEQMSNIYTILQESFGGIKVVKAFTMERYERRRLHMGSKQFYNRAMKIARYDALGHPMVEVLGVATICLAILAGAYLVLNQETHLFMIRMSDQALSLASLLVFFGMLAGASDPARKMSEVFNRLQRGLAAADRIYQMYDREPAVRNPERPKVVRRHCRDLVFDSVSFAYSQGHPVLDEINLRIPFGETLAIVGPNGCGKTTLANLIPRFFDPTSGSIHLDGIDLRELRLRDLRRQIGIVTQEPLLFDDTVYNNIRYGAPNARRDDVINASKQAHAHRFIETRLENGYQTMVGQLGGRISGGQRQRIALARAILRDPPILILDEATSQIDIESEQLIHKVLEQFKRDRTTILITHRLATLALADRILVMESGRIADVGSHEQLLGRCDLYRRLHQIQFKESA
ncbi:MAG TPA: ABC transporter ATP-binding protein [Pirellulales bacterium]|nr:ABC transporter ATP-binding protein [Pirellulales bacterium]